MKILINVVNQMQRENDRKRGPPRDHSLLYCFSLKTSLRGTSCSQNFSADWFECHYLDACDHI